MARALVLGGTGLIGSNVSRALVAAGHDVRVMHRPWSDTAALDGVPFEAVHGDVRDVGSVERAATGCDWVFHCASFYPRTTLQPAADARRGVQELRGIGSACRAAGVRRLVYTSSLSTVGPAAHGALATEEDRYIPGSTRDSYHDVKWLMEAEALSPASRRDLEVVVVNPAVVFGPGDATPTSGAMLVHASRGLLRVHTGDVLPTVDAGDAARAHVLAAERGRDGERYILAGTTIPIADLLEAIGDAIGRPTRSRQVPAVALQAFAIASEATYLLSGRRTPFLAHEFVSMADRGQPLDARKAREELGARFDTPLASSLAACARWLRAHGRLRPLPGRAADSV